MASQTCLPPGLALSTRPPGCEHFAVQRLEALLFQEPGLHLADPRPIPTPQGLLVYMFFLLVTLLANYGDTACHNHAYRLQNAIKQELDSQAFLAITRYGCPNAQAVCLLGQGGADPALGPTQTPGDVGSVSMHLWCSELGRVLLAVGVDHRHCSKPCVPRAAPAQH